MFSINGYFLLGSKSGGFCTHVCTFLPSKLVYQISSGSVRFNLANNSSLMCVNCRGVPELASSQNRSPMRVGVEINKANFEASGTARTETTAWLPDVRSVSRPVVASNAPTFAFPSLAYVAKILFPSADQIGGFPPPPRGLVLSPPTPEPTSKLKSLVRFLG